MSTRSPSTADDLIGIDGAGDEHDEIMPADIRRGLVDGGGGIAATCLREPDDGGDDQ